MRMAFNPGSITDWGCIFGGFVSASLIVTSFLIFAETGSLMISILMMLFMLVGVLTIIHTLLRFGKNVQFLSIIISFLVGGLVSVAVFSIGFKYLYLMIMILLTAFHIIVSR